MPLSGTGASARGWGSPSNARDTSHASPTAGGNVALAHARRSRGRRPAHVDDVFDRDGHAVKRPAIVAGRQLAVGVARLAAGLVGHHEDEGVEPRVVDVDAPKTLFGGLLG